jgi:uncharacterized protein YabE (DUF348 family)
MSTYVYSSDKSLQINITGDLQAAKAIKSTTKVVGELLSNL